MKECHWIHDSVMDYESVFSEPYPKLEWFCEVHKESPSILRRANGGYPLFYCAARIKRDADLAQRKLIKQEERLAWLEHGN